MTQTSFINVDLELFSKEDLSSISEELAGKIYPLTSEFIEGEYNLAFECSLNDEDPSKVINEFIQLLNSLSDESKALLATCSKRTFDIGYDSGDEGFVTHTLTQNLLSNVLALGFDIKITLYPLDNSEN